MAYLNLSSSSSATKNAIDGVVKSIGVLESDGNGNVRPSLNVVLQNDVSYARLQNIATIITQALNITGLVKIKNKSFVQALHGVDYISPDEVSTSVSSESGHNKVASAAAVWNAINKMLPYKCVYGTTTFAQAYSEWNKGRELICEYNGHVYQATYINASSKTIYFRVIASSVTMYRLALVDSTWTYVSFANGPEVSTSVSSESGHSKVASAAAVWNAINKMLPYKCVYGTTTFAQAYSEWNNGRELICEYDGYVYQATYINASSKTIYFRVIAASVTMYRLALVDSTWTYASFANGPTVDTALSSTSTNAIQNKVVSGALSSKITAPVTAGSEGQVLATYGPNMGVYWRTVPVETSNTVKGILTTKNGSIVVALFDLDTMILQSDGKTIGVISEGYRPKKEVRLLTKINNGSSYVECTLRISVNGSVTIQSTDGNVISGMILSSLQTNTVTYSV